MSRFARSLEAEPDPERTLTGIVVAAAATIPGVQHAGITLVEKTSVYRSVAPSDDLVTRLDQMQYETREGPCVDAIRDHHTFRTGDLAAETRWPRFTRAALDAGVVSMLSFRLFTTATTLGALNLYSPLRDAFDADAETLGELFAAYAAIALAGSQQQQYLESALATRDVIATAKGILMHRDRVDDKAAFAMLVEASQHANMKLRDVAAWLVTDANTKAGSAQHKPTNP
ncbi:antitermination regulator [Actinosynnema sp. ALI-1.44]|nr:antitermination regulator [Actinosynnema sp. ALI-1.44]